MKRLIFTVLMCATANSWAQHGWHRYNHYHHHHYGSRADWIVPAIIGGAVVYAATRPAPAPAVIYVPQNLPPAPHGFRYELIVDAACNCQRWVLVQGQ
jgi:hypothetical protein